jgi:exopolysaccharide biosynthesis polyprenyl glycosylphosphotransferase
MVEGAITVAEQSARARVRRLGLVLAFASVCGLVLADAGLSLLAFLLAFKLRHHTSVFAWPEGRLLPLWVSKEFEPYSLLLLFVPLITVFTMRRFGLYKLRGEFSFSGDLFKVLKAVTLSFLVLVVIAFFFRQGFSYRAGKLHYLDFSFSRLMFLIYWAMLLSMLCATRCLVRLIQMLLRHGGYNMIPTVIVGSGEMAEVCIAEISEKPRLGYKLVGIVTANGQEDTSLVQSYGVRLLGQFDALAEIVREFGVEEVLITDSNINPKRMFEVLMDCGRDHHIKYRVIPNLFDCLPGKTEIATIGTLPMIKLYEEPLRGPQRALKRGMDLVVSIMVILLTWPFWILLALLIKLESRGPVLLKQERVGMDGKMFLMIKFRSMQYGADDSIHREVMAKMINGEEANQGTPEQPIYGKVKDDPRLTRIGSWMRRYSIDELPQFINVLLGQMSVVGPRPPLPYEVRLYKDWHRARFHVKPGITGLWQVSGRNRLHFEEMVRLDIFYIENWSPWLDLKIMLKTIPVVLRGDNTY